METEAPKMKTTDLADAFTAAEDAVKLAERVSGDVALPAINQLRYALCHLLEKMPRQERIGAVIRFRSGGRFAERFSAHWAY